MNQERLNKVWYQGKPPSVLLRSLEKLYTLGAGIQRRRAAAKASPQLLNKAIIVVGNITAGGTGKTPLVMRLCDLFIKAGLKTAVVSRGYGRKTKGQVRVSASVSAREAGDEAVLIARSCPQVTVIVDENREAAALAAFDSGADVVISDDGLQRMSLPRMLEICVLDGERGLGNHRCLPAGPLREPEQRLNSVDYVIWNGPVNHHADRPGNAVTMHLQPGNFGKPGSLDAVSTERAVELFEGQTIHAVAGIGNPQRFFDTLEGLGIAVHHYHQFADHHPYSVEDFGGMKGVVLMTEKDAIKCEGFFDQLEGVQAFSLRVSAELPEAFEQALLAQIRNGPCQEQTGSNPQSVGHRG